MKAIELALTAVQKINDATMTAAGETGAYISADGDHVTIQFQGLKLWDSLEDKASTTEEILDQVGDRFIEIKSLIDHALDACDPQNSVTVVSPR